VPLNTLRPWPSHKWGTRLPTSSSRAPRGKFKLSEHRGETVVLLFYPGDNTTVCTRQFCSYRDHAEDLDDLGATIVGISSQDLDSHEAFVAKHGLNVPLLADIDGSVAKLYGARAPVIGTRRAVVVIDGEGDHPQAPRPHARARLPVRRRPARDARHCLATPW